MDRIDEVRERLATLGHGGVRSFTARYVIDKDIPYLLERIGELDRENEELHEDNKQLREANKELTNTLRFIDSNSP